jgi:hypothetical protein
MGVTIPVLQNRLRSTLCPALPPPIVAPVDTPPPVPCPALPPLVIANVCCVFNAAIVNTFTKARIAIILSATIRVRNNCIIKYYKPKISITHFKRVLHVTLISAKKLIIFVLYRSDLVAECYIALIQIRENRSLLTLRTDLVQGLIKHRQRRTPNVLFFLLYVTTHGHERNNETVINEIAKYYVLVYQSYNFVRIRLQLRLLSF